MASMMDDIQKHFDEARAEHKQRKLQEEAEKTKKAAESAAKQAADNQI